MACWNILYMLAMICLTYSKPIMVTFGTNEGPIVPRQPKSTQAQSRSYHPNPAPVFEEREDIPNPVVYKPPVPHQYRYKSAKFPKKYFQGKAKHFSKNLEYTGPHVFERQPYQEYEDRSPRIGVPWVRKEGDAGTKYVPEIGIFYSSGVRYYIPQFEYSKNDRSKAIEENSVYDDQDEKYHYN